MDTYTIKNKNGVEAQFITYGATLVSLKIPLKNGNFVDVVLGFDSIENYIKSFDLKSAPYFGAIIGRFAGRINKGQFSLNGKDYQLNLNNNGNALHGGKNSFSQKKWKVISHNSTEKPSITFGYTSPDLEENYPGELSVEVTYTLTEHNELVVTYKAKSSKDTIVNLTHHSYFNLEGHDKTIEKQELFINANQLVETNNDNIPTGKLINLEGHHFDFTKSKKCPKNIDNTFVLANNETVCATLISKKNQVQMDVFTTQPGVHIYVGGNCPDDLRGKENCKYDSLSGICFETQNFPDAPNHSNFPSAILKKSELYEHQTTFKFQNL